MPRSTPRRHLLVVLAALAVLAIAVPGVAGAADEPPPGELPEHLGDGAPPEDILLDDPLELDEDVEEADPQPPGRPFPDVPGVRLSRLGYDADPLDADLIELATSPLPEDPRERVAELFVRLQVLPPQRDGLVLADQLLDDAVGRLNAHVAARRGTVAVTSLQAQEARERAADARTRLRERSALLVDHRAHMAEVAVAAYVRPPDADALSRVLGGGAETTDQLTAPVLFSAKADHDGDVRDELEVARAVAVERFTHAEDALAAAEGRASAAHGALARAEARRGAYRQAAADVSAARSTVEAALPRMQEDLDRTLEGMLAELAELAAGSALDGSAIVTVDGIRIHAAIAPQLQALLLAARADGVPLGGWGYRTTESQIRLRAAHCGPTPEDIWLKPSSMCSPPTARPGASMHERGLAVDFHLGGRSISTRQSPGYQWLAEHAAVYGFHNLPSEPWHWSVNAQ